MEAAFFDLDKTVIAKASMVAFGRPLLRRRHDLALARGPRALWASSSSSTSAPTRSACASSASPCCGSPRLGPGPHQRDRPRHARRGHRAHRLRRGARADPRAPGRRAAGVHHLGVARGDRRAAVAVPRRRRGHRQPGPARRRGPLHGRGRVLLLRPVQGGGHAARGRASRASTWRPPTPTPTRPPTCPCSRSWGTRWR